MTNPDERPIRPVDPNGVVHIAQMNDPGATECGRYIGRTWHSGAREPSCVPCQRVVEQHE